MDFYKKHREKFAADYVKLERWFNERQHRKKALKIFSKAATAYIYVLYIITAVLLLITSDHKIVKFIAVPAAGFFAATIIRSGLNCPRPYEGFIPSPLIPKATRGRSCPSRHSACAVIIALAVMYVNLPAGIFTLLVAAVVAVSRPLMGVHFPLDVIFGAALSLVIGFIGFVLIS